MARTIVYIDGFNLYHRALRGTSHKWLDITAMSRAALPGSCQIIGINSVHHPNRQRFTLGHELGHLILHKNLSTIAIHVDKKLPFLLRNQKSATGQDKIEIQANQFAAELLMPELVLMKALRKQSFYIDDEGPLDELARQFRVSRQAMGYRIQNIL